MKRFPFLGLTLCAILLLESCTPRTDYHGKLPEAEQLKKIKSGVHSKDDVLELIGTPTSMSTFNDQEWIYDYKVTQTEAFFTPKEIDHQLYVIKFGADQKVKKIEHTNGQGITIKPVSRITPSSGNDQSFLQSIFGSFGRFAKQTTDNKKSD